MRGNAGFCARNMGIEWGGKNDGNPNGMKWNGNDGMGRLIGTGVLSGQGGCWCRAVGWFCRDRACPVSTNHNHNHNEHTIHRSETVSEYWKLGLLIPVNR